MENMASQSQDNGANPISPLQFDRKEWVVESIPDSETKQWILKKHYAKRMPSVTYAFGLFRNKVLQGVCTYGTPCKLMNDGYCIFDGNLQVRTMELNRLVVNDGLPKNALSFFVSYTTKMLPKPMCLVSYADIGESHNGYIYQATNWLYTGITEQTGGYTYYFDGDWQHPRTTVARFGTREHNVILSKFPEIEFKKVSRKHRYFMFIGNAKEICDMKNLMKYPVSKYPKGDNKRYDASYNPEIQNIFGF